MPRRHESIQAYSMNGSPLGILDLAVEDARAAAAADAAEDWEVLQPRSSNIAPSSSAAPAAAAVPFAHGSPNKLLRKGSGLATGSASSSFKAAIVAGASKVKGKSRAFSTTVGNLDNGSVLPPSRKDFTFTAPPLPTPHNPNKSTVDWESCIHSLRAELDGVSMGTEDRNKLERRMMEMLRAGER